MTPLAGAGSINPPCRFGDVGSGKAERSQCLTSKKLPGGYDLAPAKPFLGPASCRGTKAAITVEDENGTTRVVNALQYLAADLIGRGPQNSELIVWHRSYLAT
jgi:hypothetical protein